MDTRMYLTAKQVQVMEVIVRGDGRTEDGQLIPVDLDQLIERIPYETSKQSMQFSVRFLIRKGMMVKAGLQLRRGHKRATYLPTALGISVMRLDDDHWYRENPPDPSLSAASLSLGI